MKSIKKLPFRVNEKVKFVKYDRCVDSKDVKVGAIGKVIEIDRSYPRTTLVKVKFADSTHYVVPHQIKPAHGSDVTAALFA